MDLRGYRYEGHRVDFKYTPTVKATEFKEKVFSILKLIYDNELCGIKFEHYGTKVEVSFDGKSFTIDSVKSIRFL
jgi:hypothetical protein